MLNDFQSEPFIAHSQNKPDGTVDIREHRASPFVVGAGNANHVRRCSMTSRFMMSVAAAALIAGTGFANAQGTGMGREAPSGGSTVQQSAPSSSERAAPSATPANRDAAEPTKPSSGMKATQSEQPPAGAKNQRAQDDMKAGPKGETKGEKSAQDTNMKGEKSKSMSSENDNAKGAKDIKAEGREDKSGMKAEGREGREGNMKAETKGAEGRSQTIGQAGASAKLSTEQRTKITTVIKEQHVQPVTNVNFEIRPGVRIPRGGVSFHRLPREIVTIYPEWRDYEYILVNDKIVVVDPRTLEIVDVIDA
jgi:Protein of unknown function (DUF1236)